MPYIAAKYHTISMSCIGIGNQLHGIGEIWYPMLQQWNNMVWLLYIVNL